MRRLSPSSHVIIDVLAILAALAAPTLLWFSERPASIVYALAGACLLLMLLTDYPAGVMRMVPFAFHGAIELVAGLIVIGIPWLAGFTDEPAARNFFVGLGAIMIALVPITEYAEGHDFELPF